MSDSAENDVRCDGCGKRPCACETVVLPSAENGLPERQPLGAPCRHCGSADTWVEWRLEAKPVGSFSLAGAQMKFSANRWPYAVCDGCGHVSRGEPTNPTPPAEKGEADA